MTDEPEVVTMTIAEAAADSQWAQEDDIAVDIQDAQAVQVLEGHDAQAEPVDCPYDIGLDLACAPNLQSLLYQALDQFFSFLVVPLVHPRYKRELLGRSTQDVPFTRSDLILELARWQTQIIGKISPWIELDSDDETERRNSELALIQELDWSCHLSVRAVLLPPPSVNCCNLARTINSYTLRSNYLQFWVHCHASGQEFGSYAAWTQIKTLCENRKKIGVALELGATLPDDHELARWLGEPIRAVMINTNAFVMNAEGYPVLKKRHQSFVIELAQFTTRLVLRGISKFEDGMMPYQLYLRNLLSLAPRLSEQEVAELPYRDYLQSPLQPLADNLESATYETFERDPVKYSQYEKAIALALRERFLDQEAVVIMVVGAGRGPLVRCALNAARQAQRKVRVYAVEKNPNAVVTLQHQKLSTWGDQVVVVSQDMRKWEAPELADMLVSELLGSFGDNELEPECLDGAARFLKAGGISIPQDTLSYIAPMSSAELWAQVAAKEKLQAFETPYVVKLHNVYELAHAQPCFYFVHPTPASYPLPSYLSLTNFPSNTVAASTTTATTASANVTAATTTTTTTIAVSDVSSTSASSSPATTATSSSSTATDVAASSSPLSSLSSEVGEMQLKEEERKTKKHKKKAAKDGQEQKSDKLRKRVASTAQNQQGGIVSIDESSRTMLFGRLQGPCPPLQKGVIDNNRYHRMVFKCEKAATLHGFSGFFESRLYKDVALSIHRPTFSSGMFSWFPLWFPLKTPLVLPANTELEVHFWRVCTESKVWYEWATGGAHPSALHNPGGRSSAMCL